MPNPCTTLQNWSGFPGSTLIPWFSTCDGGQWVGSYRHAHPLHRISNPKASYFPLSIIRYRNHKFQMETYESLSVLEISSRITPQLLRVFLDIQIVLMIKALNLINPWLHFSVFEDGRGVVCGHGTGMDGGASMPTWGAERVAAPV